MEVLMKKIVCASLFSLSVAFSGVAMAAFQPNAPVNQQQGGFKGPSAGITTVAEALKAKDDSLVVLTGKIEKETGKEKYSETQLVPLLLKLTMKIGMVKM